MTRGPVRQVSRPAIWRRHLTHEPTGVGAARWGLRLGFGSGFIAFLLTLPASVMAQTTGPTVGSSPTAAPGPILPSSATALVFVAVAAVTLFLVWAVPLSLDIHRAYRAKYTAAQTMLARLEKDAAAGKDGLTLEELKVFLPLVVRAPEGIRGLARVLLAFLITSVIAVLALALLFSSADGVLDIVKQIITALLGVLATVIGFYFGARTSETATTGTLEASGPAGGGSGR